MNCPKCQQPTQPDWAVCPFCEASLEIPANKPVATAQPVNVYASPIQPVQKLDQVSEGDATGGVIPYKNPKALIAYYLGIVSGLPLIGLPFGIAAFVLGIMGLKARKANPAIKGSAHAWIGIGCGGLFTIFWGLAIIAMIVAVVSGA